MHCLKVGSLRMCMKVSNKLDISGLSGLLVCVKNKLTTYCGVGGKKRDEPDFGLKTETETRVVSRLVSSFETTSQKSQYQSQKGQAKVEIIIPNPLVF